MSNSGSLQRPLPPLSEDFPLKHRPAISQNHRRNLIRAVKAAFKWAEEQEHIDRSPIRHVKVPAAVPRRPGRSLGEACAMPGVFEGRIGGLRALPTRFGTRCVASSSSLLSDIAFVQRCSG